MSNTLCHKSPVIEARFFCKPGRRSYPEKRRVLHAQVLPLQASSEYLESKTSRMNPDLYIYYYVIEKQTRDRAENCNQHSTRALACLALTGVPKRRVGVWWNDINLWPYYYAWLLTFLNEEEVLMMFVALHYTLGITTWGASSSSPAVLDTWEQIVLFNVYSEINQKTGHGFTFVYKIRNKHHQLIFLSLNIQKHLMHE